MNPKRAVNLRCARHHKNALSGFSALSDALFEIPIAPEGSVNCSFFN
jgi:hypothetical protein